MIFIQICAMMTSVSIVSEKEMGTMNYEPVAGIADTPPNDNTWKVGTIFSVVMHHPDTGAPKAQSEPRLVG